MTAIRERRVETRADIQAHLPELNMLDCFWTDDACPHCKDDCCFFFVLDRDYLKTDEFGHVSGGFICLDCGWSNAGSTHRSDLPHDFDKNYPKTANEQDSEMDSGAHPIRGGDEGFGHDNA